MVMIVRMICEELGSSHTTTDRRMSADCSDHIRITPLVLIVTLSNEILTTENVPTSADPLYHTTRAIVPFSPFRK